MKRSMKRYSLIACLSVLLLCVITCSALFSASAATLTPEANKFVGESGTLRANNGREQSSTTFYRSGWIAVSEGDTVTFGPALVSQTFHIMGYAQDSGSASDAKGATGGVVLDYYVNAEQSLAVYTYTVPSGVNYVRLAVNKSSVEAIDSLAYNKYTVMLNNKFTLTEFNTYWNSVYCPHTEARTHHAAVPHGCETDGNIEYWECTCGTKFDAATGGNVLDNVTDPAAHSYGELHERVAHTATTEGNVAYYQCSVCENYFNDSYEEIDSIADPHQYEHIDEDPVTCYDDGTAEHYHCSVCDQDFVDVDGEKVLTDAADLIIISQGHDYGDIITVPAGCETTGLSAHYECSKCGLYFIDDNGEKVQIDAADITVSVLGHDYGSPISVAPDCDSVGMEEHYKCSRCPKYFIDVDGEKVETAEADLIIDALGHNVTWISPIEPTCTDNGVHGHYKCGRCNSMLDSYKEPITQQDLLYPALGHAYKDEDFVSNNDETYDQDGTKSAICYRCSLGSSKKTVTIPGSAKGIAVRFKDEVNAIQDATTLEETYNAIYKALMTYNTLSDAEKETVIFEYDRLDLAIAVYNAQVKPANAELANATTISFSTLIGHFAFLAALWFVLKKRFSI